MKRKICVISIAICAVLLVVAYLIALGQTKDRLPGFDALSFRDSGEELTARYGTPDSITPNYCDTAHTAYEYSKVALWGEDATVMFAFYEDELARVEAEWTFTTADAAYEFAKRIEGDIYRSFRWRIDFKADKAQELAGGYSRDFHLIVPGTGYEKYYSVDVDETTVRLSCRDFTP